MLLKYVSKSALKKRIDQFNRDDYALDLQDLKNALNDGDAHHDIFQDKNCEVYLTYLFTQGEIRSDVFLQGYLYLHAKEQCQDLSLAVLTDNDATLYRKTLVKYAESLVKYYPNLTVLDVVEAYLNFQGMDGWLMTLSVTFGQNLHEKDILLFTLTSPPVYPYFVDAYEYHRVTTPIKLIDMDSNTSRLVIPSIRFIQWLTIQCNPSHQVQIIPIFGRISEETIYEDFHKKNWHPCNLNSSLVKNNLTNAHGTNAGKFSIAAHDIYYHYVAMALMPPNILHFLMNVMMIEIRELAKEFSYDETIVNLTSKFNELEFSSDTLSVLLSPGTEESCGRMLGDYFIKKLEFETSSSTINNLVIIKLCQRLIKTIEPTPGINKNRFATQFLLACVFRNTIDEYFLNAHEIAVENLLISLTDMNKSIDTFVRGVAKLKESHLLNIETFMMLLSNPEKGDILSRPDFQGYLSSLSIFQHSGSDQKKGSMTIPSSSP